MLYINKGLIVSKKDFKVMDHKIYFKAKGNYYIERNGLHDYFKANKKDFITYRDDENIFIVKTA